jgi:phosphatidylinositol-3-phosphatase
MTGRRWLAVLPLLAALALPACGQSPPPDQHPTGTGSSTGAVPSAVASTPVAAGTRPDHVLVVVFENKARQQIDGSAQAPYLNQLAATSTVLTNLHAVTHPSQPNYLALFSGSTQGVTSDHCPVRLHDRPNLGRQLLDAGYTFAGYSEGLPAVGYTGCSAGRYAAKHNPWVDFDNLPAEVNLPATALPADYTRLPTVSFLIPDLCNDMHDCPVSSGDAWARRTLDPYVRWAAANNSVLVVTFDEDDGRHGNQIFTLLSGAGVTAGRDSHEYPLASLLGTIEHWYGLAPLGSAATAPIITTAWTG